MPTPSPRFSVIMPVFNAADFFREVLDAVPAELGAGVEFLLVDDCSTDATPDLIRRHPRFPKLTLLRTPLNGGPAAARNLGAAAARGEYLLFFDADSYLLPDTLERTIRHILLHPEIRCFSGINSMDSAGPGLAAEFQATWIHFLLSRIPEGEPTSQFNPRMSVIRADFFRELGGFDPGFRKADVEDYAFSKKIERTAPIAFTRELEIRHRFSGFWATIWNYFRRSGLWIEVMIKARSWDRTGHTRTATLPNLIVPVLLVLLPFFLPFRSVPVCAFSLFLFLVPLNAPLFLFFLHKRGLSKIPAYLFFFFAFHLAAAGGIAAGLLRILLTPLTAGLNRYLPLASSYLHAEKLSYLILYVTSRCNLKCNMCFYAESLNAPTGDGLTLSELEKVSKSLPRLMQLTLTGGEPFLRKELDLIMGLFIENSGARSLTIPTNGTYLEATERVLRAVCAKYPHATFKIGLSLDGTREVHNRIRGSERSYDEVAATHALLIGLQKEFPNLIVTMTGVVCAFNLQNIRALVDEYLEKFPSDDYTLQLTRGIPKDPAAKEVPAADYEAAVKYLDERLRGRAGKASLTTALVRKLTARTRSIVARTAKTNEFQVPCVAGRRLAVLYDTGVLAPCEILPTLDLDPAVKAAHNGFDYGNIRDYDCDAQRALDGGLGRKIAAHIRKTECRCTFECAVVASIFYQPAELAKTMAGGDLLS